MSKTFYHLLSTHVYNLRACHRNHKTQHVRNYDLRIAFQYNQKPHWTQRVSQSICWQHFGISTQLPFRLQYAYIFDRGWLYKKDNNRFPILTQWSWNFLTYCHLQTSSGTLKIPFFSGQFQLVCLSEPTYLIILRLAVLLNCSPGSFWIVLWPS
jgi:hypothetical protein